MTPLNRTRRVSCVSSRTSLKDAIAETLRDSGILDRITTGTRVALKPNFTYPYHKPGVTTSPAFIRETVRILRDHTSRIAVVETGGGYGGWTAAEAFAGHGVVDVGREFGAEVVDLGAEPSERFEFTARGRRRSLPLPVRLLHETDVLITMPVPKIHCMTGVTLSYKNQWGCIPDTMRLRRHYIFDQAIVAINRRLNACVLGDGTYFLDRTGPMEGVAIRMDLVIGATDTGSFDRYVSDLMSYPWRRVGHFREAVRAGDMPRSLGDISFNAPPDAFRTHRFTLRRSLRHWIALTGFRSRLVTWFGYESWFGTVVLHSLLYAIAGEPVKPAPSGSSPPVPD